MSVVRVSISIDVHVNWIRAHQHRCMFPRFAVLFTWMCSFFHFDWVIDFPCNQCCLLFFHIFRLHVPHFQLFSAFRFLLRLNVIDFVIDVFEFTLSLLFLFICFRKGNFFHVTSQPSKKNKKIHMNGALHYFWRCFCKRLFLSLYFYTDISIWFDIFRIIFTLVNIE